MRGFDIPGPRWQLLLARLMLGIRKPRRAILGMELAGEIVEVGKDVTSFEKGDKVFASTVWSGFGAYAEYKCMAEDGVLAIKPTNMTYEEAAVIPSGGITTLGIVKMANIQSGQQGLIYGASGRVGSFAVQLAKSFRAEVTGVCSTTNLEMVRSLGADKVVDYTREDFTKSGQTYDIIFDVVGKSTFSRCKNSLEPEGVFLGTDPTVSLVFHMLWTSMVGTKKATWSLGPERAEDLVFLNGLIEAREIKSVIDRRYPLDQVPEAHAYVEKGHAKGNVVITVEHVLVQMTHRGRI